MTGLQVLGVPGLPEIAPGTGLAAAIVSAGRASGAPLLGGDVVVITSKVVSKAEGRVVDLATVEVSPFARQYAEQWEKEPAVIELVLREARRVVRQVGPVLITETHQGFVCAIRCCQAPICRTRATLHQPYRRRRRTRTHVDESLEALGA